MSHKINRKFQILSYYRNFMTWIFKSGRLWVGGEHLENSVFFMLFPLK